MKIEIPPMPYEAIRNLAGYERCLDPNHAIIRNRRALDEVLDYLGTLAATIARGPALKAREAKGLLCPHGDLITNGCADCDREHREATA